MQLLAWVTSILLFVEFFDTSILYVCSVPIANEFRVSATAITQPVMSYIIGTCLFIPIISWLIRRVDRYTVSHLCIIAFALSSLICGVSRSLLVFSLARFIQGATISIASSVLIISLIDSYRQSSLVKLMAVINILALAGAGMGPLIGGLFANYLSWRIAFLINLPVSFICIILLYRYNPVECLQTENQSRKASFDFKGYMQLAGFLLLSSYGFERFSQHIDLISIICVLIGVILLVFYTIYYAKFPDVSLLPLHVFSDVNFAYGFFVNMVVRAATTGFPLLMGIYLQQGAGFTVMQTGYYLSIIAIASIAAKLSSNWINAIGIHRSVTIYTFVTAIILLMFKYVDVWIADKCLWLVFASYGFVVSMLYTAMNSVCFITIDRDEISDASTIIAIMQQFCIGLGVSLAVGGYQYLKSGHYSDMLAFPMSNKALYSYQCVILALLICMLSAATFSFIANSRRSLTASYRDHSKPVLE